MTFLNDSLVADYNLLNSYEDINIKYGLRSMRSITKDESRQLEVTNRTLQVQHPTKQIQRYWRRS